MPGSSRANYDLQGSALKRPGRGWVLEKIQISGGKYITLGASFARGKRVPSVRIEQDEDDIFGRLESLSQRHVIFHDMMRNHRRAWLIDGPSALLHLVRASIVADSRGPMRAAYLPILEKLKEPADRHIGRNASLAILSSRDNLDLVLRDKGGGTKQPEKDDKYRLRDRVKDILRFLEQIIDHHEDMDEQDGVGFHISRSDRRRLVGFDFMDVARRRDRLDPRGVELMESGLGWVDFARALHAVTLFGQGFGDLLVPRAEEHDRCSRCLWNNPAPGDHDILAVSMSDLKNIHEDQAEWQRDSWGGPRPVINDLIWANPTSGFVPCTAEERQCGGEPRIQTFDDRRNTKWSIFRSGKTTNPLRHSGSISGLGGILLGHPIPAKTGQKTPTYEPQASDGTTHIGRSSPSISRTMSDNTHLSTRSPGSTEPSKLSLAGYSRTASSMTDVTEASAERHLRRSPSSLAGSSKGKEKARESCWDDLTDPGWDDLEGENGLEYPDLMDVEHEPGSVFQRGDEIETSSMTPHLRRVKGRTDLR